MSEPLPGLDLPRLRAFLDEASPGLALGELRGSLFAGGRSNLTYHVTDGSSHWVLRRPPLGHVLATAHDMGREFRVMSSLARSAVPVPATVVRCDDPEVIGAPFYLMAKVAGTAFRSASQLAPLGAERTRAICVRMVDTLAVLHEVDAETVGLGDFGRPEGFLARQVKRWKQQLDASRSRDVPGIDRLHAGLERRIPRQSRAAIVHGDYRLDNLLVDERDEVTAVLDWEMATLGDPLTDVALLMVGSELSAVDEANMVADASSAAGFLSAGQILSRYAEQSDRDFSAMGFYLALAYFKLAVVLEGIHYRFSQGKTVGAGFERVGSVVAPLVSAGLTALKEN